MCPMFCCGTTKAVQKTKDVQKKKDKAINK
ncbi:hypothetical protein KIPB_001024, partial [Kipferlia bialata]|eukprot:g1024.t1